LHIEGNGSAYSSKSIEIEVLESLTVVCGNSQLLLSPAGITLTSPNITLAGKEVDVNASTLAISVSGDASVAGKTVTLQTSGGKVALDSSSVGVTGSSVNLGAGSGSQSSSTSDPVKITKVQMKDSQGRPRTNARVLLTKGGKNGEQRMTVLDADGELELIGDTQYSISFPDDPAAK
jgi:hypothetical protein